MRWAFYTRISDGPQVYGYSLEAQREDASTFVATRGDTLVATYEDHHSARNAHGRSEFQRMIEHAHDGHFDAVVVHKFDRFARNRRDSVVYKAILNKLGIRVYSVLEPTDPESPTSVLFEGMLEVFAKYFSANLAQEVRKGLARRAAKGLHCGKAAYGYASRDGELVATEELAAVRLALETALTGAATDMDIVRLLNHNGPAIRRSDGSLGRYTRDLVRHILTNPVYTGYIRYNGELIKGQHEAIITPAEHQAILRLRRTFYRAPRQNRRSRREYPLSGIARCGRCGGPMSSSYAENGGHGRLTYRCSDRGRGKSACDQPAVPSDLVEGVVVQTLAKLTVPSDVFARAIGLTDPARQAQRVSALREGLTERLRRARALYLDDNCSEGEWEQERDRIQYQLQRLPPIDPRAPGIGLEAYERYRCIATLWVCCTAPEQKCLARLLIAAITIDGRSVHSVKLTELGEALRG